MNQRNPSYDLIRALAIVFIVIIHSSECIWHSDNTWIRLEAAVLLAVIETGVPLFLMLSGALLLGKQESLPVFFKKRFLRIIPPFLFWSLVVFVIYRIMDGNKDLISFLPDYFVQLLTAKIHGIYWFVYMIIGLYLITPLLRIICREAKPTIYLTALVGIVALLSWCFPTFEVDRQMYAPFVPWLFSYLAGYAIVAFLQENVRARRMIQWISLAVFFIDITNRMTLELPWLFQIFSAAGLFSLLLEKHASRIGPVTRALSNYSYGIYLSHFILISALIRLSGNMLPVTLQPFIIAAVVLAVLTPMFWVADKLHLGKLVK